MVKLNRSAYTRFNDTYNNGMECNFTVKNRPKGAFTIVQNIDVHIHTVDTKAKKDNYKKTYSELWICKPGFNAATQLVDNFLIPTSWRDGYNGFYKVTAEAYLVKARPTGYVGPSRKKRKRLEKDEEPPPITHKDSDGKKVPGLPPWGTQPGRWGTYVPVKKKVLAGLTRVVKMEWNNLDDSSADLSTGADLEVTMNSTDTHI